jgi:hypothetical protein
LEKEEGSLGCKAVAMQYRVPTCQLSKRKKNREAVLSAAAVVKDATVTQQYLAKTTMYEGSKPSTYILELV